MRRTVSFPASPALLHVRTPGDLKADQSGERGSMRQTGGAVAEAAAELSYKDEGRGKTRPDSRRPTGHRLTLEKNVVEEK